LRGYDEALIDGAGTGEAIAFLDRMLVATVGTSVGPGKARELSISDCDRIFAATYQHYFGDRIESSVPCRKCNEAFELSFSLSDLMVNLGSGAADQIKGPDEEGIYTLPDGRRFRLPTAGDQDSIIGLEPEEAAAKLLECCVIEGDPTVNVERLQRAMDEIGATLDLDLEATCPACDTSQTVRFNIQSYLLRVLAYEKRFLNHEVHRIALAYGWGYQEILNLTREDRRTFARLIEAERAPVRKRMAA